LVKLWLVLLAMLLLPLNIIEPASAMLQLTISGFQTGKIGGEVGKKETQSRRSRKLIMKLET
jgi:hypothetical protein